MNFENFKKRKSEIHRRRYRFKIITIPNEKIYKDNWIQSLIISVITFLIFFIIFQFTRYREFALKLGIFAVFFSLYNLYISLTRPLLKLTNQGLEVKGIRLLWKDIKKTDINWKGRLLNLEIILKDEKVIKEKVVNFKFLNHIYLYQILKAFKKKNRSKYIFKINDSKLINFQ